MFLISDDALKLIDILLPNVDFPLEEIIVIVHFIHLRVCFFLFEDVYTIVVNFMKLQAREDLKVLS